MYVCYNGKINYIERFEEVVDYFQEVLVHVSILH